MLYLTLAQSAYAARIVQEALFAFTQRELVGPADQLRLGQPVKSKGASCAIGARKAFWAKVR